MALKPIEIPDSMVINKPVPLESFGDEETTDAEPTGAKELIEFE
jgi:hypothetical protein